MRLPQSITHAFFPTSCVLPCPQACTPECLPPEQGVSEKGDIWGAGLVILEVILRRQIITRDAVAFQRYGVLHGIRTAENHIISDILEPALQHVEALQHGVPQLRDILRGMLSIDPERRLDAWTARQQFRLRLRALNQVMDQNLKIPALCYPRQMRRDYGTHKKGENDDRGSLQLDVDQSNHLKQFHLNKAT